MVDEGQIFADTARIAFGASARYTVVPEFGILRNVETGRWLGKVDYIVCQVDDTGDLLDFALLEVQATYVSGRSYVPAFEEYVRTGNLVPVPGRPDFRSSHVKRLMPQLALKVPVVRRWGKKSFIAVDRSFWSSFPSPPECPERDNAELIWLVYDHVSTGQVGREQLTLGHTAYTLLDETQRALAEGLAPARADVFARLGGRVEIEVAYSRTYHSGERPDAEQLAQHLDANE